MRRHFWHCFTNRRMEVFSLNRKQRIMPQPVKVEDFPVYCHCHLSWDRNQPMMTWQCALCAETGFTKTIMHSLTASHSGCAKDAKNSQTSTVKFMYRHVTYQVNSLVPRSYPLLTGAGPGHETNRSMANVAVIEAWEQGYSEPENMASSTVCSVE